MASANVRASGSNVEKEAAPTRGAGKSKKPNPRCHIAANSSSGFFDPAPSVTPLPRKRASLRRRTAQRLAELYRLALFRRHHRFRVDPANWAFVLAATLACGKPGVLPLPGRQRAIRWHGLDLTSFREAVDKCDLGHFDDDELGTVMKAVERWQGQHGMHLIRPARLGEMLQLTSAEREVCRILTIDAVDEPKADEEGPDQGRTPRARPTSQASKARTKGTEDVRRDLDFKRQAVGGGRRQPGDVVPPKPA